MDMSEIKRLLEEQGTAWHEYRKTNDQRLAAIEAGKSTAEFDAKLAKMDERMGVRALVRGVKEEAPAWAGTLPQLPRLVHHALTESTRHQSAQQQRLDELANTQRTQNRLLLVIGAIAMSLLGLELYRLFG